MRRNYDISEKRKNHKPCTTVYEMAEYFSITKRQMIAKIASSKDRPIPVFDNRTSLGQNYYNKKEFIDWYKRNCLNDEIEKIPRPKLTHKK